MVRGLQGAVRDCTLILNRKKEILKFVVSEVKETENRTIETNQENIKPVLGKDQ